MKTIVGVAVCALALFACRDRNRTDPRDQTPNQTTITSGRASISTDAAVSKLVVARCEREVACKNVGVDKHYVDREVCKHELTAKLREDLKSSDCPNGVGQGELDDCLSSIQKEDCNNPIDTIARLSACKTSNICASSRNAYTH